MRRYIDADKLKESFNKYTFNGNKFTEAFNAYVDNAPAADVRENVRGEWIETDILWTVMTDDATVQIPSKICSICNKPIPQIMWNNFCPNCGADMRHRS